jgi:hypothetical protein
VQEVASRFDYSITDKMEGIITLEVESANC